VNRGQPLTLDILLNLDVSIIETLDKFLSY
jgi:hypothetical protein